ncbi:amidohydrolase family protein [Marinimicrobium sp. ARAG 43.8]|uniref:amidohydrolase family protein n=1 Tax=Marinimicrobium sp. ARAG 43.8 TaxID=3418719 RepID=UPI003CEC5029
MTPVRLLCWLALTPLLFLAGCTNEEEAPKTPGLYAFVGVNVIPMDENRVLEHQTVLVREGRIVSIDPASVVPPGGATVIDGKGRYLMPGLAEMHGHVPGGDHPQYAQDVLFLYISNGVTLVRGMAGDEYHLTLRDKIASGEIDGPTLFAASPWLGQNNAGSEAQTRDVVRQYAELGFDLLKVGSLSPINYGYMVDEANRQDIPFAGHIPVGVTLERALEAGQASIDHFDRYTEFLVDEEADLAGRSGGFFGSGVVDLVDLDRMDEAVQRTVEAGTWNVPTLSLVEHLASEEAPEAMIQWPEMRYMPQEVLDGWVQAKHDFQAREDFQPEAARALVDLRHLLLRELHDGGAPIALGSDAPQFFNVPGFSIHREMAMMVNAGLTPYEVLATGTRKPAEYFGTPDTFGQVAPGHRADLILLKENPLEDISAVQERVGVMVRGEWFPESSIQKRLQAIADRR